MTFPKHLTFLTLLFVLACGKDDPQLAKVGDRKVTKAEFEAYLRYKNMVSDDPKRVERSLDDYLSRAALAQAVEQEPLLDATALAVELDELKKEMLISRYFEKYLDSKVGEDAVRNYYNAHEADYTTNKVHVAHILVRTRQDMDEASRKAAQTRIQEALTKIRAGEDFDEVAKSYSEDQLSALKGGDLGWLKQGAVDPRFSEVMFKTKAGELSDIFHSQFGFHVIKVFEGPSSVRQPLDAVAGDIRYLLRQQARDAELKRLTAKVKTETNAAVLKTVKASPRAKPTK